MASPAKPTHEMVDAHNVSPLPFRSWCSFCVRGMAVSIGHSHSAPYKDEQIPTIAIDYGFVGGAAFVAVKDGHAKAFGVSRLLTRVWSRARTEANRS